MSQIAEKPVTVGRRPALPYRSIGGRLRTKNPTAPDKCPCCGAVVDKGLLRVDLNSNTLIANQKVTQLRAKEAELMWILVGAYPAAASRDSLIKGMWAAHDEPETVDRCLQVYISRIRKALAGTNVHILTVYDTGYRVVFV